eukprot:5926586-Prymnesium_polylepis.1
MSLNALLGAYARRDELEGAVAAFDEALALGHAPNTYTVNALLGAYRARGDAEGAAGVAEAYFGYSQLGRRGGEAEGRHGGG